MSIVALFTYVYLRVYAVYLYFILSVKYTRSHSSRFRPIWKWALHYYWHFVLIHPSRMRHVLVVCTCARHIHTQTEITFYERYGSSQHIAAIETIKTMNK